jgi:hypothetical protein
MALSDFDFSKSFEGGFGVDSGGLDLPGLSGKGALGGSTEAVKPSAGGISGPQMMSLGQAGLQILNQYSDYRLQKSEAVRATAYKQMEYWTKYQQQSEQNYRDYEVQLNQWYRESQYVEKRRQYEQSLVKQRAEFKTATAIAATKSLERQFTDLEIRYYEQEAQDDIEMDNIRTTLVAKASRKAASGQVGRTTQAIRQQFNQQWLGNMSNRQITRKNRIANKLRAYEYAEIARNNQISQVQDYTAQPINDPIKPMAPLPVKGFEPSAVSGPSLAKFAIGVAESGFDAYKRHLDMQPPTPGSEEAKEETA